VPAAAVCGGEAASGGQTPRDGGLSGKPGGEGRAANGGGPRAPRALAALLLPGEEERGAARGLALGLPCGKKPSAETGQFWEAAGSSWRSSSALGRGVRGPGETRVRWAWEEAGLGTKSADP
jgi:hypothetical protein